MITAAVLTVSDSVSGGTRTDVSGPVLVNRCSELGWTVVASSMVADDEAQIAAQLIDWADTGAASVIFTTGGTGIFARDVTPEATRSVLHRELPGLGEVMRAKGLEQTRFAPLSRATAGTRHRSLIVNLPGSPKGALFSLTVIEDLVPHIVDLLRGHSEHQAP